MSAKVFSDNPEQNALTGDTPAAIFDMLSNNAANHPDLPAILSPGRDALSCSELLVFADQVIRDLRLFGFGRRDRVAVVAGNGPEFASAVTAISTGCICVPLNPIFTAIEWKRYLTDLQISALVIEKEVDTSCREVAEELAIPVIDLLPRRHEPAGKFALSASFSRKAVVDGYGKPDDLAFLLPTSGTTSRPKVVPLSHSNICVSAQNVVRSIELRESDLLLNVLPFYHAHGLISGLFSSLMACSGIICPSGFDASKAMSWIEEFRPTWITGVPAIYQAILREASKQENLPASNSLRLLRSASASMTRNTFEALETQFGVPVIEAYGMTEAASQIASNPLPPKARKIGSVGLAAGPEVAVMDADGKMLPTGQVGEIVMRGPNVTCGYLANSEANHQAFFDDWLRTGDLGFLDSDGYLFISGRSKEIINRGGQNIAPREIEEVLIDHPLITEVAAFSVEHQKLGEDIGIAIVLANNAELTVQGIRRFAATRLSSHKLPRKIYVVPEIPKLTTGKIQRAGLAKQLREAGYTPLDSRGKTQYRPGTKVEKVLADIWIQVLELPEVDILDDFFLVGGDSLTATQVISRIRNRLNVEIPMSVFFDAPTVQGLAAHVEAVSDADKSSGTLGKPLRAAGPTQELSYAQHRLYILSKLDLTNRAYQVFEVLMMRGKLDYAALAKSISGIISRHEALRTTFPENNGRPVQRVHDRHHGQTAVIRRPEPIQVGNKAEFLGDIIIENADKGCDLENGPLVQIELFQFGADQYALAVVLHHLLTDGWSQEIFWRELQEFYSATIEGTLPDLPELPFSYRSYTAWQRDWLLTQEAKRQRAYWQRQLKDLSALNLPTDRPRPPIWSGRGARYPVRFSKVLTRKLRSLSGTLNATLFMTLMASFQCLLHRLTGSDDVAVGTFIANRNLVETENVMGMFVNTVVIRTDFGGSKTFLELLQQVRKTSLEAYEHQNLPIEIVLQDIQASRRSSRSGPVQTVFVLQSTLPKAPSLDGLETAFMDIDPKMSRSDLTLELIDGAENLHGWFEYSTDLFDKKTLARFTRQLIRLLKSIVDNPAQPIAKLDLLSEGEQRKLLSANTANKNIALEGLHFGDFVAHQADNYPDRTAVSDNKSSLTYKELFDGARTCAGQLKELGIGRDSVVILLADRNCGFLTATVAVLLAGAAFLPADPAHPLERLRNIARQSGAQAILTNHHCHTLAMQLADHGTEGKPPQVLNYEAIAGGKPAVTLSTAQTNPDDLAYVIYTSGTSGLPKGAMIEHLGFINHLCSKVSDLELTAADVVAQTAPQTFDISVWQFLTASLVGARVQIFSEETVRDPNLLADAVDRTGVTVLQVVPAVLRSIIDADLRGEIGNKLDRLRWMLCTGEELPLELCREWFKCFTDLPLVNAYGPAECADDVAIHIMRTPPPEHSSKVPIGRPISNTELHVLDAHLTPLPVGVAGELFVGGAGVGRGYLNDEEQTRRSFIANPFSEVRGARLYKTGDLACWRSDGTLEYLGRCDNQLKIRGFRIEPQEIEHLMETHASVRRAIVVSREVSGAGKRLVGFVETESGHDIQIAGIRNHLKSALPEYMVPSGFVVIDRFPLTRHGKIDRQALQESRYEIGFSDADTTPPRTFTESRLKNIWAKFLRIEEFGVFDNYFDLGGHSLLAGQILADIRREFGISLPLRSLFDHPTVAGLSELLEAGTGGNSNESAIAIERLDAQVVRFASITQQKVLDIESSLPGVPQFSLPFAFRLEGVLDQELLRRSLHSVVARHEALRTRFVHTGDGWALEVVDPAQCEVKIETKDFSLFQAAQAEKLTELVWSTEKRRSFEPGTWPMFRMNLVKLCDNIHNLYFSIDHVITDGWSLGILFEEVSQTYAAGLQLETPACAMPAIQFSDFAAWQRGWCDTPAGRAQYQFWKEKLLTAQPVFSDAASTSPSSRAAGIAHVPIEFTGPRFEEIQHVSSQCGCTTFMTMLAAFKILLRRISGQDDFCVATAMANRRNPAMETVMGPVENTVLIRSSLNDELVYRDVLEAIRDSVLEAYAHQEFPFERLAAQMEDDCGADFGHLLQVMFVNQNPYRRSLQLPGLDLKSVGDVHREGQPVMPINRTRLTVMIKETSAGIVGSCIYRQEYFDKQYVEQLIGNFKQTLSQMAKAPDSRI